MGSWSSYEVIFCLVIVFKVVPRIFRVEDSEDRHLLLLLTRERSPSDDHPRHLKRILFEKLYYEYFISMKAPFEKQARRQLEKLKSFFIVTQRIPRGNTFWMNAVFENHMKSLILQHCKLTFWKTKINIFYKTCNLGIFDLKTHMRHFWWFPDIVMMKSFFFLQSAKVKDSNRSSPMRTSSFF